MSTNEETIKKIRFAQKTEPALSTGTWKLKVKQELSGNASLDAAHIHPEEFTFSCEADPYALDSSQVYSVYPPRDSFGKFEMTLPSIVLKRRTLPWERTIPECPGTPWLALLLFTENDNVTLQTANRPNTLHKETNSEEQYMELAIPSELFRHVCPSKEDIALAVHSRYACRDDKATEAVKIDEWMSVVTAGRLPHSSIGENGLKNTVYLVSMESVGSMVADRNRIPGNQTIRLPVLTHWDFYSKSEEYDFRILFEGLSTDALQMQASPDTHANTKVKNLLEQGYVPLNHSLRDGGKTVSWYHGPLRPWNVKINPEPYRWFSDSGLIYDPQMGMFDVSISAAFQLGRMLALQDGAFSSALVQFREQQKMQHARRLNQDLLFDAIQRTAACSNQFVMNRQQDTSRSSADLNSSLNMLAAHVLLREEQSAPIENSQPPRRVGSLTAALPSMDNMNFLSYDMADVKEIPSEIVRPLAAWSLLYGVPYRYLIPHKKLLPPESIRFFHLDHNWLSAMLDGAMSLGRFFDVDYQCDSMLIDEVIRQVYLNELEIRPHRQGKTGGELERLIQERNTVMFEHWENQKLQTTAGQSAFPENAGFLSTGFLLRSDLVKGWRGLEFRAYADPEGKTNPLTALRLEAVSPDVLLGIYLGKISYLEVMQPPEGMHMGFERNPSGGYRKMLRNPENGALYDKECLYADVVMRDTEYGVMDWNATAGQIKKALPQIASVHSAYMALELIQNPATGIVQLSP